MRSYSDDKHNDRLGSSQKVDSSNQKHLMISGGDDDEGEEDEEEIDEEDLKMY